ncbi:MAG TPA: hypothetical protein VEW71_08140 [Allosphingosinicella sp.]|nr:hypothetical protein [Allosphingosinicella sp.]
MIARSFRPVGWVAAVGTAALGCYMLSLQVAAERAELNRLDARIVAASQQIRSLQTELGTRGRMQQLEEWNNEVLALSAPVSGQFVGGGVSLARFDVRQPRIAPEAEVRLASAAAPAPAIQAPAAAAPAAAVPPPLVRRASATAPAALPAMPPKPVPPVRIASSEETTRPTLVPTPAPARATPVPERTRPAATPTRTASAPERSRPAATGTRRSAALLDDRTMSALSSAARAERGGGANR